MFRKFLLSFGLLLAAIFSFALAPLHATEAAPSIDSIDVDPPSGPLGTFSPDITVEASNYSPGQVVFTVTCVNGGGHADNEQTFSNFSPPLTDPHTETLTCPKEVYGSTGVKTGTVQVCGTSGIGCTSKSFTVTITAGVPAPSINFTGSPLSIREGQSVDFTVTNTGGAIDTYDWNFGDDGSSADANPTHTYAVKGTYTVRVEAANFGGTDTKVRANYITVSPTGCNPDVACSELGCGNTDSCNTFCGTCDEPDPGDIPECGDGNCTGDENINTCSADCRIPPTEGGLVPCGGPGQPSCQLCHSLALGKNVIDGFVFPIAPSIAMIMLVVGGFFFYRGGINPTYIATGRKLISTAIIGLAIMYIAWILVGFLLSFLGVTVWGGAGKWWEITCPIQGFPSITLNADPVSLKEGAPLTLGWTVHDASRCEASSVNDSWKGNKTVPSDSETFNVADGPGTHTFILACTGTGGNTSHSVSVAVAERCGDTGEACCGGTACDDPSLITCIQSSVNPSLVGTCQNVKRVFITSRSYGGELTSSNDENAGIAKADAICKDEAKAKELPNNTGWWKAGLGAAEVRSFRSAIRNTPYYRLDGEQVLTKGFSQTLLAPIGTINVWTGATENGGADDDNDCYDWRGKTSNTRGGTGDPDSPISGKWVDSGRDTCSEDSNPFYCFEQ